MMNEFEKGLVFNFSKLGCVGLAEKLADIFSNMHVREDELLSVLTNATSEEIMRIKQAKAERLLRQAKLYNTYANLDMLEYLPGRNLDKTLIDRLTSCSYVQEAANVVITGAAGTGKSFVARALGVQACNEGWRTRIFNLRALLKELDTLDKAGSDLYERRLRYMSNIPLLILDEWFACPPSRNEIVILHELIDSRYGRKSTIICSQMPSENWAGYCSNKALGEAISGRILSHCYSISLKGGDLRKLHTQRP